MEHEWIYEYDSLTINSKKFYFRCVWAYDTRTPQDNKPSIGLVFNIWNDTDKVWIDWKEFKGSYLAEKFIDYVKHTLNGQRLVYWDNKFERDFEFRNKLKGEKDE